MTIIFIAVGIVGLFFILREHSLKEIFDTYRNFDPLMLLFYIIAVVAIFTVLTWRWDVILKSRNINIPFRKLFIYRVIGTSINFLTPGPRVGGEPTQATLMTKHDVKFTEGLTTIMIDKIIDTTTSGLLFIIGVLLVGIKYSYSTELKMILTLFGTIFIVLVVLFYYRMLTNRHFFLRIFQMFHLNKVQNKFWLNAEKKIEEIELMMIEFYKHNNKAFLKTLGISIFSWIIMFFEYKFATQLLGINVGVIEIFFIVSFIGMALLFPIPMAIGALEAGQISAFALIGLQANAGIALAFLVRMKDILTAIIGMVLLAFYGFHIPKVVKKKYGDKKEPLGEDSKMKESLDSRLKRMRIKKRR
ncbi:MAG: lysylphosphatidylglycerol synthase transmembrane domain-containing protein [Candidatus Woesearchaeota archaeon]